MKNTARIGIFKLEAAGDEDKAKIAVSDNKVGILEPMTSCV